MKRYLEDLEKELKKLNMSDAEIKEIINDHIEMLTEAQNDGVTDEELVEKFGDPDKLAKEIYQDGFDGKSQNKEDFVMGEGDLKGYKLFKSFQGELTSVDIQLINEDISYFPYDGMAIEVYAKKINDEEEYDVSFENGELRLKRVSQKRRLGIFTVNSDSAKFAIRVPYEVFLQSFFMKVISGDGELTDITAEKVVLESTSGDFEIANVESKGKLKLKTVSGDFEIKGLKADELEISLVSGDAEIENGVVNKEVYANTVSGDVEVKGLKAGHVNFRSVSGDFEGEEVYIESLELKSVSGDFEISNSDKSFEINVLKKKTVSGDVTIR